MRISFPLMLGTVVVVTASMTACSDGVEFWVANPCSGEITFEVYALEHPATRAPGTDSFEFEDYSIYDAVVPAGEIVLVDKALVDNDEWTVTVRDADVGESLTVTSDQIERSNGTFMIPLDVCDRLGL